MLPSLHVKKGGYKVTIHLHVVLWLRMPGAVPPLPYVHGVMLKYGETTLYLKDLFYCIVLICIARNWGKPKLQSG